MKLKLKEAKKLIREEIYRYQINRLNENILRSLWTMLLTPKVKKAVDQYKNEPEYKELQQQIRISAKNLDMMADRLKTIIARRKALVAKLKDEGMDIDPDMSVSELLARLPNISTKELDRLAKKYQIK